MKKFVFVLLISVLCIGSFFIYKKKNPPLVSVVMPIYNRTDLGVRAIESILNQTMKDFEFIIVDDGSKEETKQILKKYAKKDKRIKVIHNPKNRGIAYSRQRGLDATQGTYVAIMDSDDWSIPERLEKSLKFMQDHPDVTAMTGTILGLPDDKFITDYKVKNPLKYTLLFSPGFYEVDLMFYNNFPNASALFKREFAQKKHIKYDTTLISAEDYDFWLQFVFNGANLASISDTLLYTGSDNVKPTNYYEAMSDNSVFIHKKAFSRFFTPSSDELKFEYNLNEKCLILNKIKKVNQKDPQIPQIYIENRYNALCPLNIEESYYLVHKLNHWDGHIEKLDDEKWIRSSTKNIAKVKKLSEDTIKVIWEGYPPEKFSRQENGEWLFIPEGKIIKLHHINWSADFVLADETKGCRKDVIAECAYIKQNSDGTLWVDWINVAWRNEEFKKDKKGIYKFVRELSDDLKF